MDSEKAQTLDQNTRGKLAEKMVVRTCAKLKKKCIKRNGNITISRLHTEK
jgi:hypothetical protein